jgi:asparagine synthase (glutamine-hydrolysing)
MCGIAAIAGQGWRQAHLEAMVRAQHHRGPDRTGLHISPSGVAGLGHNRLSIIDLSAAGSQPMSTPDGRLWLSYNGEIYNYLELRDELSDYPFRSRSDSEVILAAFQKWGPACLDRFIGMFALTIWDEHEQSLFGARDRFGVKPMYYSVVDGSRLLVASEIKALHAAGVAPVEDATTWATYLALGYHDASERTFWQGVHSLLPGHAFVWHQAGLKIWRWYDLAAAVGEAFDGRSEAEVSNEYLQLLRESVRLRFRADVPIGINLSGGLDSSILLALVRELQGPDSQVKAFTYATGDPRYDETPWVAQMLERTHHPLTVCTLPAAEVPALAEQVQAYEDEPFGGMPTLAYARVFERARQEGVIVLLDGQGMDEQWAGYDYYRSAAPVGASMPLQGSTDAPVRPECLTPEFRALAQPLSAAAPFGDHLRNLQYQDTCTKIPRALRFNDRISMRVSTELREPFLDHRLFELAMRQGADRKIAGGTGKWLLRQIAASHLPGRIVEAPKRPLQTPQREWLRGPLHEWATALIDEAVHGRGAPWLDGAAVRADWTRFCEGRSDNSFYVWQWISLGLMQRTQAAALSARV